jgi:allene oxide cyclase
MKGKVLWTAALAAAATLAIAGLAYASSSHSALTKPTTVHVVEHAVTDTEVPSGGGADVTGNLLTFHNKVYNRSDTHVVGRDQGVCTRIDPAAGTWECNWTTFLKGGQINVDGPFSDFHNTTLAITGGTGHYRNARGQMLLKSRDNGAKYDFIFQLLP